MAKLIIVFFVVPLSGFSQFFMSTDVAERKDAAGKEITSVHLLNSLSVGTLVNNNLIIGVCAEPAVADYIKDGYNPVQDSLVVSAFQFFLRKNFRDYFVFIKLPAYTNFADISTTDRARIGGGYIVYKTERFNLEISYSALLNANENGFRKGKLSIGASTSLEEIKRFLF
ncbi:MAG: hypothetical protein CMD08_02345 [Flavobacteriales bacterium]|nr:hypothetical protein [Flavobacteriales bacterium]|tara:strand:- start:358 stop:867 length:510 start_codon:yes stop_codon:yes gene_type:complete